MLDIHALAPDVGKQVAIASSDRVGAAQLSGAVAHHVVDDIGGEGVDHRLVHNRGWTKAKYQRWLEDSIIRLLLPEN